jgi:UDP-3-O-acyl-N-acetylglucosamine deacetylase
MPRRTVAREATLSGVGLHTGVVSRLTCHPGRPGQGIVFRRTDLPAAPEIPAVLSQVAETERRTVLGRGEASVQTVEHVLAAVVALQLDDLVL